MTQRGRLTERPSKIRNVWFNDSWQNGTARTPNPEPRTPNPELSKSELSLSQADVQISSRPGPNQDVFPIIGKAGFSDFHGMPARHQLDGEA
jgi:hypothetical protein